jgi:hypothetical protein
MQATIASKVKANYAGNICKILLLYVFTKIQATFASKVKANFVGILQLLQPK